MMLNRFLRPLLMLICLSLALPSWAQMRLADDNAIAAIKAASDGNYAQAYELAADDPLTADLISWLRLRRGGAPFGDYVLFQSARPDWPDQNRLRARAEEMLPKGTPKADVLSWFEGHLPQTGEGAVRLAEAHMQNGQPETAREVLTEAWLELGLGESGHDAMMAAFPDILAPLHVARADALLWRWRVDDARRMLPLLDEDHAAWVAARIGLIRKEGNVDELLAAVPEALRETPGLLYDRYNWANEKGRRENAIALVLAQSTSVEALGEPFRWSGWRRSLARQQMRAGNIDVAYELASRHFLTEGTAFADLEWLSGYLQLTYLNDPAAALVHFDAARAAVDSPISVGRMEYWRGRAFEALGNPAARAAYEAAAQHQTSFYGLLASEKVGRPLDNRLTGAADPTTMTPELAANDLVRAGFILLQGGERARAVAFFVAMGHSLSEEDIARVAAALSDIEEVYHIVVLGKSAVTRGKLVPSAYFPLHPLTDMDLPADPALSLSIARRESEFNPQAGSPVGAQGLMQLMPATAQEVAGFLELEYTRARLTADWQFNAQLGAEYLSILEEQFGPSVVQIAAGYNAGPSRPEIWMDERGDPRIDDVDVVDWIEHIPFRETRNYVMRVSESIPVYQARLSGQTGPVQFTALLKGEKPVTRPRIRPEVAPADVTTSDAPPVRAVARPVVPQPVQGIRPIARPGG